MARPYSYPGRVPAATSALPSYELSDTRLDNGLRVVVSEDHTVPVVAVNLWYDVGSRHERAGRTGFAHLFEHLMFEGSEHVAKGEHFGFVNGAGGTLNASTWCDRTNYFETLPSNHLELALWLEADRMGGLVVDVEKFHTQREVVKNERRQRVDNQPYGSWIDRVHALAFPQGHPYHHSTIGSMADLDAATIDDVRAFHDTYYAPNNAVLTVVGDATTEQVHAAVQRYFGGLAAKPDIPPAPDGSLPARIGGEVRELVPDRVPVPRVMVAYRIPPFGTPEHDAATMLAAILGTGRGSRLYRELVLRRELAQAPDGSMLDTWPFVGGAALMVGDATAREGVEVGVLEAAYHEVAATVAERGVDDDELDRARAQVTSEWLHRLSSVDGRADTISMLATLRDDPGELNRHLPRLLAVDADRVRRAAEELVRPDNRVVIVFVPEEGAA